MLAQRTQKGPCDNNDINLRGVMLRLMNWLTKHYGGRLCALHSGTSCWVYASRRTTEKQAQSLAFSSSNHRERTMLHMTHSRESMLNLHRNSLTLKINGRYTEAQE